MGRGGRKLRGSWILEGESSKWVWSAFCLAFYGALYCFYLLTGKRYGGYDNYEAWGSFMILM